VNAGLEIENAAIATATPIIGPSELSSAVHSLSVLGPTADACRAEECGDDSGERQEVRTPASDGGVLRFSVETAGRRA
jgi:hypothetical protein